VGEIGELTAGQPLRVEVGSRQNPGNTATWDDAWVWGAASAKVARLDLVLTDCKAVPVHADSEGVFLHVVPSGLLHSGVVPHRVIAYDADQRVIASQLVKLGPPSASEPLVVPPRADCS
jgi:hypothetical protein